MAVCVMVGVCVVLLFLPVLIFYVIFILGDGCIIRQGRYGLR